MSEQTWWYLSRAGGMVAGGLLVASLVWGVLLATRVLRRVDRPSWLLAMHRWLSTLAVAGTALHLAGLVADNYTHFGWKEILVPMGSPWKPFAVTVGVLAFYLLIVIQVSSLLMKKIPKHLWRTIHSMSYLLVWTAVVHGGLAGTDASNRAYQAVAVLLTAVAVAATSVRILRGRARPAPARAGSRQRAIS